VGNEFDLDTLSIIYETPARELFSDLVTTVQTGLIYPPLSYEIADSEL